MKKHPSHGWGRTFNPCCAHHLINHLASSPFCQDVEHRQNKAELHGSIRAKSVQCVRALFRRGYR